MRLLDLIELNCNDNDNIVLVNSSTRDIVLESSCLSSDLMPFYFKQVRYIGVSNDMGTNLIVFIDLGGL